MLDGIPIAELTPAALLGIAVLFVFWGKLVPRSIVEDRAKEAELWRLAYEKEREARTLADSQTAQLLEVSRTTQKLIEAAFKTSEAIRKSGGTDDSISET